MFYDILLEVMKMKYKVNDIIKEIKKKNLPDKLYPPAGELWYDKEGRVICHMCGRAFNKLSAHIVQAHGIGSEEYKEIFGLNRSTKLTSKGMQEYFRNQERVDVTTVSSKTQFKAGEPSKRKRGETRLQTYINRPGKYKKREKNEENE